MDYNDIYTYDIDYTTYSYNRTGFGGGGQLTSERVPEDFACLLIFSPQKDISAEEAQKIIDYLEGDSSHCYPGYPCYIVPAIGTADAVSDLADSNSYTILAYAQGIQILTDVRSTVTADSLLTTSGSAYSKTDIANYTTSEKEDGDIDGPFTVGTAVTEEYNDVTIKLVYFTSSAIMDETMNAAVSAVIMSS